MGDAVAHYATVLAAYALHMQYLHTYYIPTGWVHRMTVSRYGMVIRDVIRYPLVVT